MDLPRGKSTFEVPDETSYYAVRSSLPMNL